MHRHTLFSTSTLWFKNIFGVIFYNRKKLKCKMIENADEWGKEGKYTEFIYSTGISISMRSADFLAGIFYSYNSRQIFEKLMTKSIGQRFTKAPYCPLAF